MHQIWGDRPDRSPWSSRLWWADLRRICCASWGCLYHPPISIGRGTRRGKALLHLNSRPLYPPAALPFYCNQRTRKKTVKFFFRNKRKKLKISINSRKKRQWWSKTSPDNEREHTHSHRFEYEVSKKKSALSSYHFIIDPRILIKYFIKEMGYGDGGFTSPGFDIPGTPYETQP